MSKTKPTRKQLERRKRRQHVIFFTIVIAGIVAIQTFYPSVVDTALTEVRTLSQKINIAAKEGTTLLLTIAGLIYAWKLLRKS